jgi:hypothetical protein
MPIYRIEVPEIHNQIHYVRSDELDPDVVLNLFSEGKLDHKVGHLEFECPIEDTPEIRVVSDDAEVSHIRELPIAYSASMRM